MALAAQAGCDLVVLDAAADDWTRQWYTRRGFVEVTRSWSVRRRSSTARTSTATAVQAAFRYLGTVDAG